MARARLVGINHVALEVGDLDAALHLYGRLFDLRLRGRVPGMAFVDMGRPVPRAGRGPGAAGDDRHFGLVVATATRRAALVEAGLEPHGNLRFTDPWGNEVEVVEYGDVQFTKDKRVLRGMGLSLEKTDDAQAELREKGLAD